ncbi:ABC transporter ATP-binding protein [Paenibacillus eucommiae]|uniref:Acetoin utilization transport system ATP-binding protein n=1 Tax=Paenibacillus eucommiae TaxID=1355755 RepID=A0ABS4INF3_9BACL|nr:ABC transporter ATP-binding protein [Paenibacillus eucommiae]MBP1989088.1 acetoin utilization transport system ATP-binding protein [Paenibacillus eucommiae]
MIELKQVSHQFKIGKKTTERIVPVLHDISLHIEKGEIVAIVGRSGSGKSTLLNLISGYLRPSEGEIYVQKRAVTRLSEGEWADFRLQHFGFIFQSFQLIPSMTAFANVELPLVLKGVKESERRKQTLLMLERVGLQDYAEHYPSELSGGQQQRVSIARALIVNPPILLADEPTGSLDSENEHELLRFIEQLNKEQGITFLIITHDDKVASFANRTILLQDGKIVDRRLL